MKCQYWPEISFYLAEVEKEKQDLIKKAISLDTITSARENINQHIEQLRLNLEQSLDKDFVALILFATVAYVDEEIQRCLLEKGQANWVPLQKDFYGAYNAGNLYFETIDKFIEDPHVPIIVFKVFYFFLKKGFLGKYRDSKIHIAKYLEILKEKIPIQAPLQPKNPSILQPLMIKNKINIWHYYSGAACTSLVLLLTFYFISNM